MHRLLNIIVATSCVIAPTDSAEPVTITHALPGHNDCLPEGEAMDAETCLQVVEEDGRLPTTATYKPQTAPPNPDTRLEDPEYAWYKAQIQRCTCSCCHTASWGGPGLHKWDLEYGPMWIDSASDWSLQIMAGYVEEGTNQVLPVEDLERVRAVINAELDRRAAAE